MNPPDGAHVLIVDDDREHAAFLAEVVAEHGYKATTAASGPDALDFFAKTPCELVVTDVHLQGMDGVRLISIMATHPARPALIAITAFGSLDTALRLLRAGAVDCLSKPFRPSELIERIRHALDRRARRLEQQKLQDDVDELLRKRRG